MVTSPGHLFEQVNLSHFVTTINKLNQSRYKLAHFELTHYG